MKRLLIACIIPILILTACVSPAQRGAPQQVTVTLEVTVTLPSPTETPTPLPTPSPETPLPPEVKDKFDQAGIDLKDMQNAKYDKNGLHITLESGEVVLLTNEELEKNIYLEDGVIKYRDEANQNVNYAYDKETGKWVVEVQYLSSTDGTVLWTKEGMADGELRVKDEKAKELRNDTIRALWAVNNALVNPAYIADTPQNIIDDHTAFLAQFPSANVLIQKVNEGVIPDFIYILVNNSKALSVRSVRSCEIQKIENVDLSKVVIKFDIVPQKELLSASQTWDYDFVNTPYCDLQLFDAQLLIEPVTLPNGNIMLSWTFRSGYDVDKDIKNILRRVPFYSEQPSEDKLSGASALTRTVLAMTTKLRPKHADVNKAYDPPIVLLNYMPLDYYANDSTLSNSYFELSE